MLQVSACLARAGHSHAVTDEGLYSVHFVVEVHQGEGLLKTLALGLCGCQKLLPLMEELLYSGLNLVRCVVSTVYQRLPSLCVGWIVLLEE